SPLPVAPLQARDVVSSTSLRLWPPPRPRRLPTGRSRSLPDVRGLLSSLLPVLDRDSEADPRVPRDSRGLRLVGVLSFSFDHRGHSSVRRSGPPRRLEIPSASDLAIVPTRLSRDPDLPARRRPVLLRLAHRARRSLRRRGRILRLLVGGHAFHVGISRWAQLAGPFLSPTRLDWTMVGRRLLARLGDSASPDERTMGGALDG